MKFKVPKIAEVLALSDEELSEFMGQGEELKNFKAELGEMAGLSGKAREEAERLWSERMTPMVSPDSLRWMKEDAVRAARTPQEVLKDTSVEDLG